MSFIHEGLAFKDHTVYRDFLVTPNNHRRVFLEFTNGYFYLDAL
jgi:hypothetical protein